jgi:hypothetical protein
MRMLLAQGILDGLEGRGIGILDGLEDRQTLTFVRSFEV